MILFNQRIPLTTRIYSGYLAVGLVTLTLIAIGFLGLNKLGTQFSKINSLNKALEDAVALNNEAGELQLEAELYIEGGENNNADKVRDRYTHSLGHIEYLKSANNGKLLAQSQRIEEHLTNFTRAFGQAQSERIRNRLLVDEILPSITDSWPGLISGYQSQTITAWSLEKSNHIWRNLLSVEKYMKRYFDTLDYSQKNRVEDLINETYNDLDTLIELESYPSQLNQLKMIRHSLESGERVFNEAVQVVRGYLFIINVVMAADSYEMRYLSDELAKEVQLEMNQVQTESRELINSLLRQMFVISSVFLAAAMIISISIGRSILKPIIYLRETFDRLSNDEPDIRIQEFNTKDEIAALAKSAEVFREANSRTNKLLDQYQELSSELENKVTERTAELAAANERLSILSVTDPLTDLANRRFLDEELRRTWARSRRSSLPVSVIMLDIDFFKLYNDHYGHQAGDECLQAVASVMKSAFSRTTDIVARYGGEEFVVVLQDTQQSEAEYLGELLRSKISKQDIEHVDSPFRHVTVSVGIACFSANCKIPKPETMVKLADNALYQSKNNGRNRITTLQGQGEDFCAP